MKVRLSTFKSNIKKAKANVGLMVTSAALLFGGTGLSLLAVGTAHAANPPVWNVSGNWKLDFAVSGGGYDSNLYDLSLHQNGSSVTGTGQYPSPGPYQYAWSAVGSVSGDTLTLTDTYTMGAVGTTMHMTGTIASNGTLTGTWDDNYGGGRTGTWKSVSGDAVAHAVRNFGQYANLRASACPLTRGSHKVVNVSYRLYNDYDSGIEGNAWANDTINRSLSIWQVSDGQYCAIVSDHGTISTFSGASPNGAGTVGSGVMGLMQGGYRTEVFSGSFAGDATYKTHGYLGAFNLACTSAYNCPGAHPAYTSYFTNDVSSVNLAWWGWEYNTCQNGNWVNAIDGNYGDITGNASSNDRSCDRDEDDSFFPAFYEHNHDSFPTDDSYHSHL